MNIPRHLSSSFHRHSNTSYSADASMLTYQSGRLFAVMYGECHGEGFYLVSAKSGREMRMIVTMTHRNADGDVTHWTLRTVDADAYRLSCPVITVTVWNT